MRLMPPDSVDAVVTDPPYGIRFMGKAWDGADIVARTANRGEYRRCSDADERAGKNGGHNSIAAEAGKYDRSLTANQSFQEWTRVWCVEALRILKPGGHLLSFSSPRTFHRMVCGVEDAGFEIRDTIMWVFGSGFPKSHNLHGDREGWGTALKPAFEPITVARKPLEGTVAANVAEFGTGAINVDGCRVPGVTESNPLVRNAPGFKSNGLVQGETGLSRFGVGRWPANLVHDGSDEVVACFPQSSGQCGAVRGSEPSKTGDAACYGTFERVPFAARGDTGSAARFFYCAKASKFDREEGLNGFDLKESGIKNDSGRGFSESDPHKKIMRANNHPTVKPTDLMRWLCRLVTPPGGTVFDPFCGSGSTGKAAVLEGFGFVGAEREAEYCGISSARLSAALEFFRRPQQGGLWAPMKNALTEVAPKEA